MSPNILNALVGLGIQEYKLWTGRVLLYCKYPSLHFTEIKANVTNLSIRSVMIQRELGENKQQKLQLVKSWQKMAINKKSFIGSILLRGKA